MKHLFVFAVLWLGLLTVSSSKPSFPFVQVEKFFPHNKGKVEDVKKLRIVVFMRIHFPPGKGLPEGEHESFKQQAREALDRFFSQEGIEFRGCEDFYKTHTTTLVVYMRRALSSLPKEGARFSVYCRLAPYTGEVI